MEDILASIRRIIAEDQSQGLARGGLAGLTRRAPLAEPRPEPATAAVAEAPAGHEAAVFDSVPLEAELHQVSEADPLRGSYADEDGPAATDGDDGNVEPFAGEAGDHHATDGGAVFDLDGHAAAAHAPEPDAAAEGEPLMSLAAGASITSSFQALAESVVLQDPGLVERVMRETMRPLLKEWLDDHLPSIVERLVRVEIERVARGGRGRD